MNEQQEIRLEVSKFPKLFWPLLSAVSALRSVNPISRKKFKKTIMKTEVNLIRLASSMTAALSLITTNAFAGQSNPPWFPSLMGFEHYDSGRTHLFEQARFGGSYGGNNQVLYRVAPAIYPSGYNTLYASPDDIFLYGGCYGNISNNIGSY